MGCRDKNSFEYSYFKIGFAKKENQLGHERMHTGEKALVQVNILTLS